MIRTIIVEDEPLSLMYLKNLLSERFEDIEIVGTAATQEEALSVIAVQKPDLIFLDIELRAGNGIHVATELEGLQPKIIFTTALDEQATNLLQMAGLPFIQKPIDFNTLALAVRNVCATRNDGFLATAIDHLRDTVRHKGIPQTMLVRKNQALYVSLRDIITIKGVDIKSHIRMASTVIIPTQLSIKEFERLLERYGFFRTHMQWLVNLKYLRDVLPDCVIMEDSSRVLLSPKQRERLHTTLASWAGSI